MKDETIEIDVNDYVDVSDYIGIEELIVDFDITDDGVYVLVENSKQSSKNIFEYRILLFNHNYKYVESVEIDVKNKKMHYLRVLNNKKYFVVNARCKYYHNVGIENNARLFDEFGTEIRKFALGDGIQDIREWKDGLLMVSYYDEGIFGNYGWGKVYNEEHIYPLGRSGIVLCNIDGEIVWEYTPSDGHDRICDCYAMNLDDKENLWFQYYTEFKLVRVDSNLNSTYYDVDFGGGHQITLYRGLILAYIGYNKDYFVLSRFNENNIERLFNVRFKTELDENISTDKFMKRACKSKICFYVGDKIYIYDLKKLKINI